MAAVKRRGRGVDFEHRFKASRWAEDRLLESLGSPPLVCARLGLSGVGKDNFVSTIVGAPKVPDLIVFRAEALSKSQHKLIAELNFDLRDLESADLASAGRFGFVFEKALCAIEVEFSPYRASEMKGRHWTTKTPADLAKKPRKTAKAPIAPNIFVKEEDVGPLMAWQKSTGTPIVVIHVFDQESFALDLSSLAAFRARLLKHPEDAKHLCLLRGIFREEQAYDRTDAQGARETKTVYKVTPAASRIVGAVTGVKVEAQLGISSSGKYVSQVVFKGGKIKLSPAFIDWLAALANRP